MILDHTLKVDIQRPTPFQLLCLLYDTSHSFDEESLQIIDFPVFVFCTELVNVSEVDSTILVRYKKVTCHWCPCERAIFLSSIPLCSQLLTAVFFYISPQLRFGQQLALVWYRQLGCVPQHMRPVGHGVLCWTKCCHSFIPMVVCDLYTR